MADAMSSRTKSSTAKSGGSATTSQVPAQPAEIPRVETPDNGIDLAIIWVLLHEMQQQVVSLQELVGTVGQNLVKVEGTINGINNTATAISDRLDQLEKAPHTLTRGTQPLGEEATPRPPIHLPTTTRPHVRSSNLDPPPNMDEYHRAWGLCLGGTSKRTGATTFRTRGRTSTRSGPETKPLQTPDAPQAPKPPKMREPEDFDGTKGKAAKQWVTKAIIWATAQHPNYESEEALVLRLFSFMKPGKAGDWAQPHLARIINRRTDAVTTQLGFLKDFADTFEDPDAARVATRQIETLKQDGLVADYNTTFDNLQSDLEWNDEALRSQYDRGLQH